MKVLLVAINAKYIHANPAIYSLRAYAKKQLGSRVPDIRIREYTINQYTEDILADIYKEKADLVAFSCYIWNIGMVEELVELIHRLDPEKPVWLGGPEVSYDASECLARNPGVTGIMRGEGEATFAELMAVYVSGDLERLGDIKGIICKKANDELIDTGWREYLDINDIPFFYEDMGDFESTLR